MTSSDQAARLERAVRFGFGGLRTGIGLCRGALRLSGRSHPGALAQCLQQVARLRGRRRLLLRQGPTFDLRLDQLGDRCFITVVEGLGVERALLRIDDVLREFQHLAFDLQFRQLVEGFFGRAHFIIEVQRRADQAVAVGTDQNCSQTAKQDGARERGNLRLPHAVAQQLEGVRAHFVWCQIIGLVEIDVIDFVAGNESLDLQRLVAVRDRRCNFFRFEYDILAILDLISFDLIVPLNRITRLAIDKFAADSVSCRAIERVEGDAFG